ncbi:MAG: hypothetical protein ABI239_02905 [Aquihabitans sp.]
MGMGSGSKASAGCGAFGLVGVLITIGIIGWLFVTSTDSISSSSKPVQPRSTATTALADALATIAVTASPDRELGADPEVNVTADGWQPGSDVTISTCLAGAGLVLGGDNPCDPDSNVTMSADDSGKVDGPYRVDRVVRAGGLPYDCADDGITCAVRATGTVPDGRSATGDAIVAFQTGLPAPDLLDELGG